MAGNPITTIPPFADTAKLPACATSCGPLYDANGACVPPAPGVAAAAPSVYTACFCSNAKVAPFSTGVAGVCDGICQPDGMTSIMNWFQDICSVGNNNNNGGNNKGGNDAGNKGDSNGDSGNSNQDSGSGSSGNSGSGNKAQVDSGGGDWLSNHWQWVIMLVILVVGIAGIWIGACIWRRRHLRKKDRQSTLPQKQSGSVSHPSWGPGMGPSASDSVNAPGVFMPESASASPSPYEEKPKKKWLVRERT